jgi:hypothetical protein
MALPNADLNQAAGLALVRRDPDDEWHFVCWVIGSLAMAVETLSPGTHRYELWEIIGNGQSDVLSVTYDGPAALAVIQMHR